MCSPFRIMLATGALLAAAPAYAQTYDPRYPVCMHVYSRSGGGGWYDCSFTSLPQCRATASGRAATCDVNPYYAFNEAPPVRRHYKRAY
jgi:hypothetical protein